MTPSAVWITIVALGLVTVLTRGGLFVVPERHRLPLWLERALRYAPACALAAIIVPDLHILEGGLSALGAQARLLGMLAGVTVFLRTRSMLATITLGMLVFTLVRWAA